MTIESQKKPRLSHAASSSCSVAPEASDSFVYTPYIQELTERAIAYLEVGYPVHLAGPAGTGKTTLAFHIASQLGRAVTLIHGNEETKASDWVGNSSGYRKRKVVDNYIRSVVRSEEELRNIWIDNRLTTACINGEILIYDEFNRSRPETNNIFLSVLSEKLLDLPQRHLSGNSGYIEVHPQFRAIFTSNPEEYAGTHKAQDALMDRLITLKVGHFDRETEIKVLQAKSGIQPQQAEYLIDIIIKLRNVSVSKHRPTIRAGIAIAKVLAHTNTLVDINNRFFRQICYDILSVDMAKVRHDGLSQLDKEKELIDEAIQSVCGKGG
jgi:nitric oxide reductase NorQ protein